MPKYPLFIFILFIVSCSNSGPKNPLIAKTVLPHELKEISGITAQGSVIWAITDKPRAMVYKLDSTGKLLQVVTIENMEATDVEAVASDDKFVYLGDVGDNIGDRIERKIIKVLVDSIPAGMQVRARADTIIFSFPNEGGVEDKKENNFDCESLLSFKDSLYVFTKDREDKETKLYVLPKTPGKYEAKYISSFNSEGLVTDAAINADNTELALIGYHKGHQYPFMFLFTKFKGNNFFSGDYEKIELANKPWDWQLEGITYSRSNNVYFSCEGTKQVPATFYGIKRSDLLKLNKKKKISSDDEESDDDYPGLSKKGHLKLK